MKVADEANTAFPGKHAYPGFQIWSKIASWHGMLPPRRSARQSSAEAAHNATGGFGEPGDQRESGGAERGWSPPLFRRKLLQACAAIAAVASAGMGSMGAAARAANPFGRGVPGGRLKWLAFYGQTADEAVLSSYDLVVLDPMFQGDVSRIAADGARVCAYLSLGEIRRMDAYFGHLDVACLIEENPSWPGTWRVDVRQGAWKDFVLHDMLPAIVARGFTGLMLDTLDTPPWLEQTNPTVNTGMRQASIDLVQAIRDFSPDMLIIVNRGYAILPDILGMVDAVLAESLLTTPDPDGGGFRWNSPSEVAAQLEPLVYAKEFTPPVPVLSLDYWDTADAAGVREVYRRQRALGHVPYVATPLLGEITTEPAV